ncbi:MAG: hypothetical protein J0H41_13385 [Rhizobiales bacterium]|nr:hypothetical protein [Hyphomicrobiales bacterium]
MSTTPASVSDRIVGLRAILRDLEHSAASPNRRDRIASGDERLDGLLGGGLACGGVHDIHAREAADSGAATGFALAWAARAQRAAPGLPLVWITQAASRQENGAPYGPGLAAHGLDPDALIIVRPVTVRESLWALEKALRAGASAAAIAEFEGLPGACDLTASRRLLLAAQTGGTPGLLLFIGKGGSATGAASAAATRFVVSAQASREKWGTPGQAAWRVEIVKNRIGRTGECSVEWDHDVAAFRPSQPVGSETVLRRRVSDPADGSAAASRPALRRAG